MNADNCDISDDSFPTGQRRRKVVVIGAGVSGLAAARKLHSLGYEVLTLEGKDYVGGRVNSYKWGKYTADLGAMVITGLGGGNPLYTLCRQVNLKTYSVRGVCPLHDHTGKRIGKQLDDELEHEFNALLDETRSIGKHAKKMPELSDKKLSLGDVRNTTPPAFCELSKRTSDGRGRGAPPPPPRKGSAVPPASASLPLASLASQLPPLYADNGAVAVAIPIPMTSLGI